MTITRNTDYVFAEKSTLVSGGVVFVSVIGTKNHIFIIPKEKLSGAGRTVINEKFGTDWLKELLSNLQTTKESFEKTLRGKLIPTYILDINLFTDFNIKTSFFSKGLYYKKTGDRGWSGLPLSKNDALDFKNFYGK